MKTYGSIYKWLTVILLGGIASGLLFSSCAVTFHRDGAGKESGKERGVERSDPLGFPGDELIVTETDVGLPDYSVISRDTITSRPQSGTTADYAAGGQGYDVQFYATLNIVKARQIQHQTDTLTEMPVRVVFEEPYYKVIAGPYRSFEEAETFLRAVTELGFSSAWIVGYDVRKGK